jgi:sugar phosphate isomerase/epimerase
MDRRKFLRNSITGALAAALSPQLVMGAGENNRRIREIGIITNTIKKPLEKDYVKTLEEIAEIGYDMLEFGGHYGPSKKEFMNLLKRLKIKPIAGGTSMHPLLQEPEKHIEEQLSMNKDYLVCYWPWTTSADNLTTDQCKKAAENLNKVGEKCKKAGIRFAFHNHDKEFKPTPEGDIPMDILLKNTEPELVTTEIDLYWIKKGGGDPISYFKKYPGRFELCHVKDMGPNLEERRDFACVGSGIMDFPKIFAHSKTAGIKHYIVEHDEPEHHMECARTSYNHLSELRF